MKVISLANRKGGVGKTTVGFNLGYTLALEGRSVLFIDLDSQCNLSLSCGANPLPLAEWKKASPISLNAKISILPGSKEFNLLENEVDARVDRNTYIKKELLPRLPGSFDYAIIDTPPSMSTLNINAFCVSQVVLIVINPDFFSLSGLVQMREILGEVKELSPDLSYKIVVNSYTGDNRRYNQDFLPLIKEQEGFCGVLIPQRQHFIDRSAENLPAIDTEEIEKVYKQLAQEVI